MAGLIVKSPYLKCGGGSSVSGYLRYIGTRERVELLPDDRPPTRKQEQLVRKLTKDFPEAKELDEYSDYETKPTKANASAFITRALEENWAQVQQSDGYMKYIATRPRAERLGDHGLFGDADHVDLDAAMLGEILRRVLYEFPVQELDFALPRWVTMLAAVLSDNVFYLKLSANWV